MTGTISRIVEGKGFGFITGDGGAGDFFFHRSALRGIDIDGCDVGDRVSFEVADSPKGPRAENVVVQPIN